MKVMNDNLCVRISLVLVVSLSFYMSFITTSNIKLGRDFELCTGVFDKMASFVNLQGRKYLPVQGKLESCFWKRSLFRYYQKPFPRKVSMENILTTLEYLV